MLILLFFALSPLETEPQAQWWGLPSVPLTQEAEAKEAGLFKTVSSRPS
jgi:hypothetical protein